MLFFFLVLTSQFDFYVITSDFLTILQKLICKIFDLHCKDILEELYGT